MAWWNVLVSVVACAVVLGRMAFLLGGTDIEVRFGGLLSVVGLGVVLKWG